MTKQTSSFLDLLSDDPNPGAGALIGIQGDAGTGKTTIGANADDPVLHLVLDPNSRAVAQNLPTGHRIQYAHLYPPAGDDVPLADRQAWLRKVNTVWNGFLAGDPHPVWGVPFKSFIWDTATRLWDAVYPLKVQEKLGSSTRKPGPLDYVAANDWMRQVSLSRATLRPDSYVLVLLHEQIVYVPDPENPGSTFRIPDPRGRMTFDGWKETPRDLNFFIRLIRREEPYEYVESGTRKKGKRWARYGIILKHPNEMLIGTEFPSPTWSDIKEWME